MARSRLPGQRARRPILTPEVPAALEGLARTLDALLLAAPERMRLSARVRREQRRLRRVVSDDAWHVYLKLEAIVNERAILEQDEIAEWAFEAGVTEARTPPR